MEESCVVFGKLGLGHNWVNWIELENLWNDLGTFRMELENIFSWMEA